VTELDAHFSEHLLPAKNFFTIREVAAITGLSASVVLKACDEGRLLSHAHNGGNGQRMTRRIPRQAIALFLLQTKTYAPEDYLAGIVGLLGKLSAPELRLVRDQIPRLIERTEARTANAQGIDLRRAQALSAPAAPARIDRPGKPPIKRD